MRASDFAIAFSEKEGPQAIKELSLKIKLIFPKDINLLILLFSPHYNPAAILEPISLTLKPQKVIGLGAPFLIFEEKIIQKGIIACCINKPGLELKEFFLRKGGYQEISQFLSASFKSLKRGELNLFSFLSPEINPAAFMKGIKLSLGKVFNLQGGGFSRKYSLHKAQITNRSPENGLIVAAAKGLAVTPLKISGYLPLGKPFTLTKVSVEQGLIMEINRQPAVNIYKHYLGEKFDTFIRNHLFSFYPLGIWDNDNLRIINITSCLPDGSLTGLGDIKQGALGHITFLEPSLLLRGLKGKMRHLKTDESGLAFIINSLPRKRILKTASQQEISSIKHILGDKLKVIGFYGDYSFACDRYKGDIDIEGANLLITLIQ